MKQPLSQGEIGDICARLGHLVHAGVGLAGGGTLLGGPVGKALEAGLPCSEAMAAAGGFPQAVTALVRIGEESGRLEQALSALAEYYQQRHRTQRLLTSALWYPAMTLVLMLVVVGVLLVRVLPIFDQVYASLGTHMTGAAAGLLQLGKGIRALLPVLFVLLGVGAILCLLTAWWPAFREKVTGCWQKAFADRGIRRKFSNARYLQGLALATGSGMALEQALELAAELMEDPSGARRARDCAEAVRQGMALDTALEAQQLLDHTGCALVKLGIRSGQCEQVLADIAQKRLEQAQEDLEDAIGKIEPALVMGSSVLVGLILLSVMLPLMDILSVLG